MKLILVRAPDLKSLVGLFGLSLGLMLTSLTVHAQSECRSVFIEPRGNLSLLEINKGLQASLARLDQKEQAEPYEKISQAERKLTELGVLFHIEEKSSWWSLKVQSTLVIETSGNSTLNLLAKKMFELYGTRLVFAPEMTSGNMVAGFLPDKNLIYIPEETAFTGVPDAALFHEIRHATMTSKEKKGEYSLTNGLAYKAPFSKWPWGEESISGYKKFFSLQEVSTWHQGFNYKILEYRGLLRQKNLTVAEVQEYLNSLDFTAFGIFTDTRSLIKYEFDLFKDTNKGSISYSQQTGLLELSILGFNLFYAQHIVPAEVAEPFWKESFNNTDKMARAQFIKTPAGQELARTIAINYLSQLGQKIDGHRNEVLGYGTRLRAAFIRLEEITPMTNPKRKEAALRQLLQDFANSKAD